MTDGIDQYAVANIATILAAVTTAIVSNWTALRQQTIQLQRSIRMLSKKTHADLEALSRRVGAIEVKVEGMLGMRREGDRMPSQSGGDPEKGHLPPSTGGQGPPLA